jgi:hypothetical protein
MIPEPGRVSVQMVFITLDHVFFRKHLDNAGGLHHIIEKRATNRNSRKKLPVQAGKTERTEGYGRNRRNPRKHYAKTGISETADAA